MHYNQFELTGNVLYRLKNLNIDVYYYASFESAKNVNIKQSTACTTLSEYVLVIGNFYVVIVPTSVDRIVGGRFGVTNSTLLLVKNKNFLL